MAFWWLTLPSLFRFGSLPPFYSITFALAKHRVYYSRSEGVRLDFKNDQNLLLISPPKVKLFVGVIKLMHFWDS
ncbi:hypothetical protein V6Z11_A07G152300 [Gossypium hirsutum]